MTAKDITAQRYDRGMYALERAGLSKLRRWLAAEARGDVLEIGTGTGANLGLYQPGTRVTATDLEPKRLAGATEKARQNGHGRITILACADAQDLPFPDDAFDTVLGTLVFCSIKQPEAALAEVKRVLRPDGRFLLLEHVRGQTPFTRRLTDWLHPAWFALQGSCHLNRETASAVTTAGFQLDHVSTHGRGLLQLIIASPTPQ